MVKIKTQNIIEIWIFFYTFVPTLNLKQMKETLNNLEKVNAYTIRLQVSERETKQVGVYNTYAVASEKAKGAGWYGTDGEVYELENIYVDDNGILYNVKKLGDFTDVKEKKEQTLLESVTAKLTAEEMDFIKNKLK